MSREESEGKSSQSNDQTTTESSASEGNLKEETDFPETTRIKSKNKFIDNLSEELKVTVAEQITIRREDTRSQIAGRFLYILISTYLLSFLTMIGVLTMPFFVSSNQEVRNDSYTYTKDIISLLITTQTGLVGSIIGFYFGSDLNSK